MIVETIDNRLYLAKDAPDHAHAWLGTEVCRIRSTVHPEGVAYVIRDTAAPWRLIPIAAGRILDGAAI